MQASLHKPIWDSSHTRVSYIEDILGILTWAVITSLGFSADKPSKKSRGAGRTALIRQRRAEQWIRQGRLGPAALRTWPVAKAVKPKGTKIKAPWLRKKFSLPLKKLFTPFRRLYKWLNFYFLPWYIWISKATILCHLPPSNTQTLETARGKQQQCCTDIISATLHWVENFLFNWSCSLISTIWVNFPCLLAGSDKSHKVSLVQDRLTSCKGCRLQSKHTGNQISASHVGSFECFITIWWPIISWHPL